MQKNSTKASILIWAIFISLIISVSFIQISTKINKNLKNNEAILSNLNNKNELTNMLNNAIINNNFQSKILSNGDNLIFDYSNDITFSIGENASHISKINTGSIVRINILEGGPIAYKNNSASGLVNNTKNFAVTPGDLFINNIGGHTKINIQSNKTTNNLSQYMNYKITRKIGNKEIEITHGKIKNF